MADFADDASAAEEIQRDAALASRPKFYMAKGTPGECDFCGEWSSRLVGAACPPCRDRYKLD